MAIDWKQFLTHHGIEYVERGANVSHNNVAIHCPFCGAADPSHHMEVNLTGKGWRCWRRPKEHSGKSPVRLIQALLGCSREAALRHAGSGTFVPQDFMASVHAMMRGTAIEETRRLDLLPEFKPIRDAVTARPFIEYLRRRDFSDKAIARLTRDYGLRYCTRGPFKGRIIFPIYHEGKLVNWTGRSIYKDAVIRYRTLSDDPEAAARSGLPMAVAPITRFFLWFDQLMESDADTIVLVEGPFDALKVNVLGRKIGVVSTCCFTAAPSRQQVDLLHDLLPLFKRRYLLLDRGTIPTALKVLGDTSGLGLRLRQLGSEFKDPGELKHPDQLQKILID